MRNQRGLSYPSPMWMKALMTQPSPRPDLFVTMIFDPEEGIADLETHLERLKREADAAGFRFDHHAARNELQAATFGKRTPATARLMLSPTGAMAIEVRAI